MKQIIRKRLCIVILTAMLTTLLINYYIEIHNAQNEMYTSAREMFWQVGQILDQNEKEAEKERENLKELDINMFLLEYEHTGNLIRELEEKTRIAENQLKEAQDAHSRTKDEYERL